MKNLFILFALLFISDSAFSQTDFYTDNKIPVIKIYFPFSDWDFRLDTAINGADAHILADSVVINGVRLDSVGVKYKGNSSYNLNNKKNPLNIALDLVKTNQDYQGYNTIKLSNGFSDPSFLREVMGYEFLSRFMDAPKANFASVYINDVWRGVYTNIESINKSFCGDHYYSKSGNFFKCNPASTSSSTNLPTLVPNAWDTVAVYPLRYEMKSLNGWTNPNAIHSELDIDRTLWMHAFNNVIVNLDSYTGQYAQNYYMYRDANNIWIPTIWDLNMCFGSFTSLGAGNNLSFTGMQQLSPMAQSTNAQRPLISNVLANPTWKKMYIAHCKTILNECMHPVTGYRSIVTKFKNIIKDSIAADSLLFYSYQKFIDNIDTAVLHAGSNYKIGLAQLMDYRAAYLINTPEYLTTPPVINTYTVAPASLQLNNTVTITTTITNADTAYLGYREVASKPFTRVKMYDDGLHGDGAANDDVYGASFIITSGKMDFYIYAQNTAAGIFSPEKAEHEFHSIQPNLPTLTTSSLVINELLPSNTNTLKDSALEFDDYIELHNKTNSTINLNGLFLTDDMNNFNKWAFPSNANIPANSYLIVWADQDVFQGGLHTNFKLNSSSGQVFLTALHSIIDSTTYGKIGTDTSWARCLNGVGNFEKNIIGTPNANNYCPLSITQLLFPQFSIFPNPAKKFVRIEAKQNMNSIKLYNQLGQSVQTISNVGGQHYNMSLENLASGFFVIEVDGARIKLIIE
jgi:hypothetical protein